MPQYPTHPNGSPSGPTDPRPEEGPPSVPMAATPERLAIDLPPFLEIVRSTVDQALDRTKEHNERLLTRLSEMLEELRQERRERLSERASIESLLQSLLAATQRVESLVERETATLTAARRQLWDEAAAFKQEIRREIRWFIRTPLVAVVLLAIVAGMLWMHREPSQDSRDSVPTTQPTKRLERGR